MQKPWNRQIMVRYKDRLFFKNPCNKFDWDPVVHQKERVPIQDLKDKNKDIFFARIFFPLHDVNLNFPFGTKISNFAPVPGVPVSVIIMPVFPRISRIRKRPEPAPFPEPNSNIFSFLSGGIPEPLSSTIRTRDSPERRENNLIFVSLIAAMV